MKSGAAFHLAGALLALSLAAQAPPEGLLILDAARRPVVGAKVELWPPLDTSDPFAAMAPPLFRGETDEVGRVEALPPARPGFLLLVDAPEHPPYHQTLSAALWQSGLVLKPGWAWRGRVEGETQPLPAGRLCATWTEELAPWKLKRAFERCAPTGADGHFELRGLPPRAVAVRAEVPGFLLAEANVSPSTAPTQLRLSAGLALAGQVVAAATGKPVEGAQLTSAGSSPVSSDEQGVFLIAVETEGATVTATAPGYLPLEYKLEAGSGSSNPKPLELRLAPGQGVSLALTDEAGLPIAGGYVSAELTQASGVRRSWGENASAGPQGRIFLSLPEAGRYRLAISTALFLATKSEPFELGAGQVLDLGSLALEPGAAVSGRLVDAVTDQPIAGAEVGLEPLGLGVLRAVLGQRGARTVTDRAGNFRLDGLPAGRGVLSLNHPSYAQRRLPLTVIRAEERALGSVWLDRGIPVRGRVRAAPASLGGGLLVRVFEAELPLLAPVAEGAVDELGAFALPPLSPGNYRLELAGSGPLLVQGFTVYRGGSSLELELVPPFRPLSGQVVRAGNPVPGGRLHLLALSDSGRQRGKVSIEIRGRREARTVLGLPIPAFAAEVDSEGRFTLPAVPPGVFELSFESSQSEKRVTRRVELSEEGAESLVVELEGGLLSGEVIDGDSKGGLEAAVSVWDERGLRLASAEAGADGRFELRDLPAGPGLVVARAPGYAPKRRQVEDLAAVAGTLTLDLERMAAGGLEVRLVNEAGEGVGSVLVTLVAPGQGMVRSLLANAEGLRRFAELAPASYFVVVDDPIHGLTVSPPIEVAAGEQVASRLVLAAGSFVSATCADDGCDEAAIEDLTLVERRGDRELTPFLGSLSPVARFSSDGRLGLGPLAPGEYEVEVRVRGRRRHAAFTVAGEEPTVILLR